MMRHPIHLALVAFVLLAAPSLIRAQSAPTKAANTAAVRRAALDYLEGFYEGDSVKLVRSVRPNVAKFGFWLPRNAASYRPDTMSYADFLSYARNVKAKGNTAPVGAPKEVTVFDVQDRTASAKVRAFWGTDYLLLGNFDGTWMITHVLWQSPPRPASH